MFTCTMTAERFQFDIAQCLFPVSTYLLLQISIMCFIYCHWFTSMFFSFICMCFHHSERIRLFCINASHTSDLSTYAVVIFLKCMLKRSFFSIRECFLKYAVRCKTWQWCQKRSHSLVWVRKRMDKIGHVNSFHVCILINTHSLSLNPSSCCC